MQQGITDRANDKRKRRIFVDNGVDFVEVGGRIIEPYTPPTPALRAKTTDIVNAPSFINNMSISKYKVVLNLLFKDRQSFRDYMNCVDQKHKFYDEKGAIYMGAVEDIKYAAHEALTKYTVEISLVLIKKDWYEIERRIEYQDIGGLTAAEQEAILNMANIGLLATKAWDGESVQYFRPTDIMTRAEMTLVLNNLRKNLERAVRK